MNIDMNQINQLMSNIQFPVGKNDVVQFAQQRGANPQIVSALNNLPDKNFNSPQELQDACRSVLGNIDLSNINLGSLGDMGKNLGNRGTANP